MFETQDARKKREIGIYNEKKITKYHHHQCYFGKKDISINTLAINTRNISIQNESAEIK